MKSLLQLVYCLLVYLLLLLQRDSWAEARRSPVISEKDSTVLHDKNPRQLEVLKVESAAVFEDSDSKKVEKKSTSAGVHMKKQKDVHVIIEEELAREMIEHIDYAGATTHPPSEPPKKKKTNSHQKSLRPPSRAH